MNTITPSIAEQAREHNRVFNATFSAARKIRSQHVKVRPHRALTPLKVTPYLVAQAIILPMVMCGLLLWGKPLLLDFWRACISFWSNGLDLMLSTSTRLNEAGQYTVRLTAGADNASLPSATNLLITSLVTLIAFLFSMRMNNAKLPLKYPIRIICFVQALALLYFWLTPATFPYSISQHSEELLTVGFVLMMATPVMLAVGYYILNQQLALKIFHTVLILAFFAILIPHQVLMQALIMQHLSVLFMPVLYLCFGAVFDALVFIALYSWIVSDAPPDATV